MLKWRSCSVVQQHEWWFKIFMSLKSLNLLKNLLSYIFPFRSRIIKTVILVTVAGITVESSSRTNVGITLLMDLSPWLRPWSIWLSTDLWGFFLILTDLPQEAALYRHPQRLQPLLLKLGTVRLIYLSILPLLERLLYTDKNIEQIVLLNNGLHSN